MTKPIDRDPIYCGRAFDADILDLCCRWYVTYRLSYRDLAAIMAERGVSVSHTTLMRWIIRYVPEFEKRWTRLAKGVNSSWRVDETYIKIGIYFALSTNTESPSISCYVALAEQPRHRPFFRKALCTIGHHWPKKVTLDGHRPSHLALR